LLGLFMLAMPRALLALLGTGSLLIYFFGKFMRLS